MALLNPAALILLALAPVLLLLHLDRRRKVVHRVSSLLLWQKVGGDGEPRARWRRLRDPLVWLQILVLVAVVVALARPVLGTGAGRDVVFLFDSSASMGALEPGGSRFDLARERALEILDSLGRRDRVQLLQAGPRPRVVTGFLADRPELRRQILALEPWEAQADLPAALLVALSASGDEGLVYVFSDGAGHAAVPPSLQLERVRYLRVGDASDNVAITRLTLRPSRQSPFDHDLFTEVANFAPRRREVTLVVEVGDRVLWSGKLALGAKGRQRIAVEGSLRPGEVVRARLGEEDALAADNRAYALVPPRTAVPVLLVTEGNLFLEKALEVAPSVALTVVPPRGWTQAWTRGSYGVVVLDGFEPEPPGPMRSLVIRPPPPSEVAEGRALRRPELALQAGDHPILASVELGEIAVERASVLAVPPGGRVLLEGAGEPVLVAWEREGRRRVVLGFDVQASTWPQALSFPVFMANTMRWLAPGGEANPVQLSAGEVLEWSLPPPFLGLSQVTVRNPHGSISTVAVTGGSLVFEDTGTTGIYSVRDDAFEATFVVNLFSDEESDIGAATTSPPGEEEAVSERWGSRPVSRGSEVSLHLILLAVLVLLGEWAFYCRRSAA